MKIYMLFTAIVFGGIVQTMIGADAPAEKAQKSRKESEITFHAQAEQNAWSFTKMQWESILKVYAVDNDEFPLHIFTEKEKQMLVVYTKKGDGRVIRRDINCLDRIAKKTYVQLPQIPYVEDLSQTQLLLGVAAVSATAGSVATLALTKKCTIL